MVRVIIVDDEQLMREALQIMVAKVDGFEVVRCVDSGEEAVELCKSEKVDLVFMDIMMPGMSGIEASKLIYLNHPDITIYIVSAYNNFEFAREALQAKVKEYISKPVSSSAIKALLEKYIENHDKYGKQTESLFTMIKDKNFREMYYQIPKIVDEICFYDVEKNSKELKSIFMEIGQNLINYLEWLEDGQRKCEELFPMSDILFSEKKSMALWLFNVMNYIFQQTAIKKYKVLESVFSYIDQNVKENIGLNEIVNHCSISQGYLSRIFVQQMKVSVVEYLHMRKLMLAKAYFSFTDLSIIDVAFRLGYNESSYFSKVFKKYEHITVYQYKQSIGNT